MIKTPTLLLDEQKCRSNIKMMYDKALGHDVELRPHFKTHQSLEIGRWFKAIGVQKITVSSLTMASYFSEEWEDILVAFPTNINEIETINALASKVNLHLSVENLESITYLSKHLKSPVNIYIQIDVGYNRTGIQPNNINLINGVLRVVDDSDLLTFVGFFAHSGHTYTLRTAGDIKSAHAKSLQIMSGLSKHYPFAKISLGDTPACSLCEDFSGVDEIRPGNFVFYDLMQHQIGSCDISQIAVALACPVVAIHQDRSEIVIYGGGVHFSKDRLEDTEGIIFGRLAEENSSGWGRVIPNMYVKSLSQEHGIVSVPEALIEKYRIGDHVLVLPVHSCMTADLMKSYRTLSGKEVFKI
jgi:D-serine deaminase-like pyridoxal phosphate-dependent protein